jgi:hypothetical protein
MPTCMHRHPFLISGVDPQLPPTTCRLPGTQYLVGSRQSVVYRAGYDWGPSRAQTPEIDVTSHWLQELYGMPVLLCHEAVNATLSPIIAAIACLIDATPNAIRDAADSVNAGTSSRSDLGRVDRPRARQLQT